MKICHFLYENKSFWGNLKEGLVYPFLDSEIPQIPTQLLTSNKGIKTEFIKFLLPVSPTKIVCVGRNYAEHATELGNEIPKHPLLFLKAPSSLITENDPIIIPEQSKQVEHEGELAIVIRQKCQNLTIQNNPFDYVLGYTCLNDVTARDLQRIDVQFTRAKSFDTFCPVAAFIETELDVLNLRVQTRVNGIIKQDGRTSQMVFPVDFLIRYISNQMTLQPGDIIATGTPAGVSKLNVGDICEVEIEGIGCLTNPVSE